jgi:hypothetical protein
MAVTAMQQDASLLALMLILIGCTYLIRTYWFQLPWTVLGISLTTVFVIDALTTKTLALRLYLFDLIKFGKEFDGIRQFANIFITTRSGQITLVIGIIACIIVTWALLPRPHRPRLAWGCFGVAAALALLGHWRPATMNYLRYDLLENFITANMNLGADQPYSANYARRIAEKYEPFPDLCQPGQSQHPSIIILTVESLSTHHSMLFSGIRDLTPQLDAIAKKHVWFPNFIANGFTTDGGLIAILTGRAPIPAVGRYQSVDAFAGFDDPRHALPDALRPAGYTSHFFTTGDLGFLDKPAWLKALHFDSWEGAEHPFYNGWKRRHFNAAEDKALYQRFLQWLDRRSSEKPFMATLLTVSTHPPFIDPRNESPDEEGAFRYADEQIGMLYRELEKRDFFRNGILLISGDHRSMTPLLTAEQKRFGNSAMARTPFVIAGNSPLASGPVNGWFQQTDITPSLADLTQAQTCRTPLQGWFLRATPLPADYILHARSDMRNRIKVFFNEQQAEIVLNGDHSDWDGPRPAAWRTIFDGVMLDRIQRGVLKENIIDFMTNIKFPEKSKSEKESAPAQP